MGIHSRNLASSNGYNATMAAISATNSMQGGKVLPGAGRKPGTAIIQYTNGMVSPKTASAPARMPNFTGETFPGLSLSQDEVLLMASLAEELRAGSSRAGGRLKKKNADH